MYSKLSFKDYLAQLKITEITIDSYMRDATKFCEYLRESNIDEVLNVTKKDIDEYCNSLLQKGQAVVSVQRKIASLKKLFDYLKEHGFDNENPVVGIKLEKTIKEKPKVLSKEEISKLLSAPRNTTAIGIRDKAMLELICATGIKVSELVGLDINCICFDGNVLFINRRGQETKIELCKELCGHLKKYYDDARPVIAADKPSDYFFLNSYGEKLSRQGFWKIIKRYSKKAEITGVTPEAIRRSFACHHANEKNDIEILKDILGHSDIATTKAYVK